MHHVKVLLSRQRSLGGHIESKPGRKRGTKLVKCDLWLGLEDDIVRHACLSAPVGVISPLMRQIPAIGDR